MTFVIPGLLKRPGKGKAESVSFFLEGDDREDARWQAHHGVVEANVARDFPAGTVVKFDVRKLRRHQ